MARIGFQMIMFKQHTDFAGALKRAADVGFDIAEPWGWKPPLSCVEQCRLAEAAGLNVCSGHFQPDKKWVAPCVDQLAEILAGAGARAWVMPGGYGGKTVEEMQAGAAKLRDFYREKLLPRGLKVEYHNHATDIQPMFDGKTQVDLLLEYVPELTFQPDIGNAFAGGQTDTRAFLEHYGERISCLHIKDVRKDYREIKGEKGSCATGDGLLDIRGAVEYAKSLGVEDFIIEQEGIEGDEKVEDLLRRSHEYVSALL